MPAYAGFNLVKGKIMQKLNGQYQGSQLPQHIQQRIETIYRRKPSEVLNSKFEFNDGVLIDTNLD